MSWIKFKKNGKPVNKKGHGICDLIRVGKEEFDKEVNIKIKEEHAQAKILQPIELRLEQKELTLLA